MTKGTDYTVDKKQEVPKLVQGGEVETWWRIYATSKGGTYFHIDVSDKLLLKADELLTAKAKALDAI